MEDDSIYDRFAVSRVINAAGEQTRIGGTLIRAEAVDAMTDAAGAFAPLRELQASASRLIAEATSAQAGYVTSGAASALTLATAACIAGDDYELMNQLPRTETVASDVVIPRAHRTEYDVAFRAAGARLVDAGGTDHTTGGERLKPWELESAITDETVAVAYVARPHNELPLADVVAVADDYDLPVIVDAAAELPPAANLSRFVETGAAAVAFSGGKAVRGPQTTGILAATQSIVRSVALQHLPSDTHELTWELPPALAGSKPVRGLPNHGIGRPMKVGKEEIVGLLRALELFLDEDQSAVRETWNRRAERIATDLDTCDALSASRTSSDDPESVSEVVVEPTPETAVSMIDIVAGLRTETPSIYVRERHVTDGKLFINPKCLSDEESTHVVDRVVAHATGNA